MNPWPFVVAAYVITLGGAAAITYWAWTTMRRAEAEVERLRDR
jgi:protein-S-isoprenylcysteine O-methyltransferase Ste14